MRHRRSRIFKHRSNGRSFHRRSGDNDKIRLASNSFLNGRTKNNFRPNQSAEKLLERYKLLAKEALSSGDKILSENYLQHADHFTRILNEKESMRKDKLYENKPENINNSQEKNLDKTLQIDETNTAANTDNDTEVKKNAKSQVEVN